MERKGSADHIRPVEKKDQEPHPDSGIHGRCRTLGQNVTDVIEIALETSGAAVVEADAGDFAVHPDGPLRQPADEEDRRGGHHVDWREPFSL